MNQNPEQKARDEIDKMLKQAGWLIQSKKEIDINAGKGVAVREYQTEVGPADYILFVSGKPVGVIEAKREEEGHRLTIVEEQSSEYAKSKLKYLDNKPLNFVYESTGILTRFTDYRDPKPRSRPVFSFHRPETFERWLKKDKSLRARFFDIPKLNHAGLRPAQIIAIENLEKSFRNNNPRALIQMATGAGKTFTAATFVYRLLKHAGANRILFLVDTKNLGEQAEQEFIKYQPRDDNRKFTELYNVQRLSSNYIATDSDVCISTIQRLYSILKDEPLDEELEKENPNEKSWQPKEPMPVVYNKENPIEQFDFIIIDECHRSIYNLWRQVLEYYDAFLIGLTATPDGRTLGFFNENLVSEYTFDESVADGVNVSYDTFIIETKISKEGSTLKSGWYIDKREKLSRKKRWETLDEDKNYSRSDLDKDVVNPSQIRKIITTYKQNLPVLFPGRSEVPKTLIFAKTDSHADDIINIVRKVFNEGNDFCKKVTYKASDDPKTTLNKFRNSYNPRIAVTVDMIATGTDVKPLECLLFMRDVRSTNYFQQMLGRGCRTINYDDLKSVTPSVISAKTHFIVVDAVGVLKSKKTDSRPLERKRSASLKDLLAAVAVGANDEDLLTTLAGRLNRLEKKLTEKEKEKFKELSKGKSITKVVKDLLNAYNPDIIEERAEILKEENNLPSVKLAQKQAHEELKKTAISTFNGKLNEYVENVRRVHEQIIDTYNIDKLQKAEWDTTSVENAKKTVTDFEEYLQKNKDEITALKIYYNQPYNRRNLTFDMLKEVLDKLKADKPALAPHYVWEAYTQLEEVKSNSPKNELTALVSLIRKVTGIDKQLTAFDKTTDKNFQTWVFKKNAGNIQFTENQMEWLRMIKEHVANSFHFDKDDLDYAPFDAKGGLAKMWQLFGNDMETIISELNEALAA
ncbi:MAG: DEAD/DEAH box helicase family protein [Chlorobi bacterium]|nr:DEAD/DEAH box helicase family protein [Chlorobiota bacterium]